MFQSKRARLSARRLRRCESHETSHCVWRNGPGLPLDAPIQCSVTTASDSNRLVTMCSGNSHRPFPPLRIHGTLPRRERGASASARLEILRSGEADLMPLGQCLRRYVLSYARALDTL